MKSFLSIDPGYEGTAYALWQRGAWRPWRVETIKPSTNDTVRGAIEVVRVLRNTVYNENVRKVGIEWPRMFGASAVSYASTARGDLFKLAYLVGAIANEFKYLTVQLIPVNDWKGQMSKEVCQRRILKRLEMEKPDWSHHAFDAVGIGLYMDGRF